MKEGRQGNSTFNVISYKNNYADLRKAFGNDLVKYYQHYIKNGKREGRVCIDYSAVFNATYYANKYSDLKAAFGNDQDKLFRHFLNNGMREGRQASAGFDVKAYKNRYQDLRLAMTFLSIICTMLRTESARADLQRTAVLFRIRLQN